MTDEQRVSKLALLLTCRKPICRLKTYGNVLYLLGKPASKNILTQLVLFALFKILSNLEMCKDFL